MILGIIYFYLYYMHTLSERTKKPVTQKIKTRATIKNDKVQNDLNERMVDFDVKSKQYCMHLELSYFIRLKIVKQVIFKHINKDVISLPATTGREKFVLVREKSRFVDKSVFEKALSQLVFQVEVC